MKITTTKKDELYIKNKMSSICAILSGVYLKGYVQGKNNDQMDSASRDMALGKIQHIVYQIYKRGSVK